MSPFPTPKSASHDHTLLPTCLSACLPSYIHSFIPVVFHLRIRHRRRAGWLCPEPNRPRSRKPKPKTEPNRTEENDSSSKDRTRYPETPSKVQEGEPPQGRKGGPRILTSEPERGTTQGVEAGRNRLKGREGRTRGATQGDPETRDRGNPGVTHLQGNAMPTCHNVHGRWRYESVPESSA